MSSTKCLASLITAFLLILLFNFSVKASPPLIDIKGSTRNYVTSSDVIINAIVSDDEQIVQVEFFIDGKSISIDTVAPYIFTSSINKPGIYSFNAVAKNSTGQTTFSNTLTMTINPFPPQPVVNVKSFGALGDGKTDDRAALQAAVNSVSQTGGTIFLPACKEGQYYRVTQPVYWASNVSLYGEGSQSLIYNDRPLSTSAGDQLPVLWGNYGPSAYNEDESKYYETDTIENNIITLHSPADISNFKVGQILIVRSTTGWMGTTGSFKPYVMTANMIESVQSPNILIIKYRLDTPLASGKVAINGNFLPGSGKAMDTFRHPTYFIHDVNVENVGFKSKGQWLLFMSLINANWKNIWTYGAEAIGGNFMVNHHYNHIYSTFWKQVSESSMGSYNSEIVDLHANWINNPYLLEGRKPLVRFGENCHRIIYRDFYITAGNAAASGIAFDNATDCVADNINIVGTNISKTFVEFNNGLNESIVSNNLVKNSTFTLTSTVTDLDAYIMYVRNNFLNAILDNNTVKNCDFYGKVKMGANTCMCIAGTESMIKDNYFEYGNNVSIDPLTLDAKVVSNDMLNPSLTGTVNVLFKDNYK
jgi:hypothetical protein